MRLILKAALVAAALSTGAAAMAQAAAPAETTKPVPLCSKTMKDECMNPPQAPHHAARRAMHRHNRHAAAPKKAVRG